MKRGILITLFFLIAANFLSFTGVAEAAEKKGKAKKDAKPAYEDMNTEDYSMPATDSKTGPASEDPSFKEGRMGKAFAAESPEELKNRISSLARVTQALQKLNESKQQQSPALS